jgi:hypothetical protein
MWATARPKREGRKMRERPEPACSVPDLAHLQQAFLRRKVVRELRELTRALKVRQRLRGWTNAIRQLRRKNTADAEWLLLVLDVAANTIGVTGFDDRQKASEALAQIEKPPRSTELDAVLVWVGSVKNLRRAYSNYYADTRAFLEALTVALR